MTDKPSVSHEQLLAAIQDSDKRHGDAFRELRDIISAQRDQITRLETKIEVGDYDKRIRTLEGRQNWIFGAAAVIGGGLALIGKTLFGGQV